jgi:Helix-turn-helix domain
MRPGPGLAGPLREVRLGWPHPVRLLPGTGKAMTRKADRMTDGATLRRSVIGAALRRYREALGYPLDDPARILDCDRSKISRIENGIRAVRLPELR